MAVFSVVNFLPSATNLLLFLASLVGFLFYYLKRKYTYWEQRGVPYARPTLFFGNIKDHTLQRVPMAFVFQKIYKELDGHKFGGFYQFTSPCLLLRDPSVIKIFLVKSFSHFHDRNYPLNEQLNPLSTHLIHLTGQRWRSVRYKLTPTFSSGKLKLMQDLMKDCIKELDAYLSDVTSDSKTSGVLNLSELMAKYTTDVIGSCAFGFRCNSIQDENSEFRRIGRLIFKPSYQIHFRTLLKVVSPRLISVLKLKGHRPEVEEFFTSGLREAVGFRHATAQKRNDFMQLLIDIQAEEKQQLQNDHQQNGAHFKGKSEDEKSSGSTPGLLFTDTIIAANAFLFFLAGFETTASTLSYCLYELALNPVICNKVRDEVESVKRAHNGKLDYDAMKELVYMESVLSETLRKYPVVSVMIRQCTKAFQIPGTSVVIEKGTNVTISIYGLHHDPKFFPEPEKFLPERFSEENKDSIKPGTYLPFGDGPRICIGMRFAMMNMKLVLSYLVSNFTVHPCVKTAVPLEFDSRSAFHRPLGGIWVRFQRRPTFESQLKWG